MVYDIQAFKIGKNIAVPSIHTGTNWTALLNMMANNDCVTLDKKTAATFVNFVRTHGDQFPNVKIITRTAPDGRLRVWKIAAKEEHFKK